MSKSIEKIHLSSRKRIALFLIILGIILAVIGAVILLVTSDSSTNLSEPESAYFSGSYTYPNQSTYRLDDTTVAAKKAPSFHTVTTIKAESGTNPKTNEASDILLITMDTIPDRDMNVVVLISTNDADISFALPDNIVGLQWILTYSDGKFYKTARAVNIEGVITQENSDDFNIQSVGYDDRAEVEFYGPIGTKYYAVMIYDDTYCTLIVPD